MKAEILDIAAAAPAFRELAGRAYRPLAQHSHGWQRLLAEWGGWTWQAVVATDGDGVAALLPFCVRQAEPGRVAMSNPLPASYGGVLHRESVPPAEAYAVTLRALLEYGGEHRLDLITILTSPFRDDLALYEEFLRPDYRLSKFYQYLPGETDLARLPGRRLQGRRTDLARAREIGFSVRSEVSPEPELMTRWYRDILIPRFQEIAAAPPPPLLFPALVRNLAEEQACDFVSLWLDEDLVGGGFALNGWCRDIYARATLSRYMKLRAGVLLDHEMLKRGAARGAHAFNFQSSPSRQDATFKYKQLWGCLEGTTHYLVRVLTDVGKFTQAGREEVAKQFPHFFVLPFEMYD